MMRQSFSWMLPKMNANIKHVINAFHYHFFRYFLTFNQYQDRSMVREWDFNSYSSILEVTNPKTREQARDLFGSLLRSLDNTTATDEESLL